VPIANEGWLLVDGLIILVYFVAITGIGLYMGRREKTLNDFALGGRRVPWWAVMASIIAAETSAATFLGVPGEGYTNRSFAYVQVVLGLIIGRVVAGRLLPGKVIGNFRYAGTRSDDPNDLVPHEHRRELRALRVFGAWMNLVDLKAGNTLEVLRGGKYLGRVEIIQTSPDKSVARVNPRFQQGTIQEGDRVATRIRL